MRRVPIGLGVWELVPDEVDQLREEIKELLGIPVHNITQDGKRYLVTLKGGAVLEFSTRAKFHSWTAWHHATAPKRIIINHVPNNAKNGYRWTRMIILLHRLAEVNETSGLARRR